MQGRKIYQEKLFTKFRLSQRIPKNNFYRRLKKILKLNFLYEETKDYYAQVGQKSIDPIVFFKLCLVGYIENITNDRQLIEFCSLRLDILYFLGYGVEEKLPCPLTISRTRNKFPLTVFNNLLGKVIEVFLESGLAKNNNHVNISSILEDNVIGASN
ncbi:MAG: transposase [Bacteroidota bacterium]